MKSQAIIPLNKALKKRVFIGLSGGVDSSVSAALLKQAGYEVTGVFIKVWQPNWLECTWKEERRDAMRVAAHLEIPFVTLDLEEEYKRDVVDYMLDEYRAGRTPNPDVMCNKAVKFGAFYDWAIREGADYVATGHYAQIQTVKSKIKNLGLQMSVDLNKDQSYFLWNIRTEQLPHILFPIGHLEKPEVRKLAAAFKLPTAEKKDSQGICFIGMVDMKTFLSHYIETKKGSVLNESGNIIGTHPGAIFFTIGERHGFKITEKSPSDEAYYVVAKNVADNTITVRMQDRSQTAKNMQQINDGVGTRISISQTNWIGDAPILCKTYQGRSRYRQALENISFEKLDLVNKTAEANFESLQETLTPGQSLVIYDGNVCLGGGIIN